MEVPRRPAFVEQTVDTKWWGGVVFKVFSQNRIQQHRLSSRTLTFQFHVEVSKVLAQDRVQQRLHHLGRAGSAAGVGGVRTVPSLALADLVLSWLVDRVLNEQWAKDVEGLRHLQERSAHMAVVVQKQEEERAAWLASLKRKKRKRRKKKLPKARSLLARAARARRSGHYFHGRCLVRL